MISSEHYEFPETACFKRSTFFSFFFSIVITTDLAALCTSWSFSGNLSNFSSFFLASCVKSQKEKFRFTPVQDYNVVKQKQCFIFIIPAHLFHFHLHVITMERTGKTVASWSHTLRRLHNKPPLSDWRVYLTPGELSLSPRLLCCIWLNRTAQTTVYMCSFYSPWQQSAVDSSPACWP